MRKSDRALRFAASRLRRRRVDWGRGLLRGCATSRPRGQRTCPALVEGVESAHRSRLCAQCGAASRCGSPDGGETSLVPDESRKVEMQRPRDENHAKYAAG